jgi:hypothetical protein
VTACRFTEKFEFLYGLLQLPDLDSAPSSCYARVFRRCSRIGSGPAVRCGFSACIGRLEHHHQRVRKAQRIFSVDFYQFVVTVRYADPDRSDKSPLVQAHVARNDSTDVYTAPEPLNTFGLPDLASRVVVGGSKSKNPDHACRFGRYSGLEQAILGEQQRLAFSRILVHQPKLVILDESTSAMNVEGERTMCCLPKQTGITSIRLQSHDVDRYSVDLIHTMTDLSWPTN